MQHRLNIGIIGDYDPDLQYHAATQDALHHAATAIGVSHDFSWIATRSLTQSDALQRLRLYHALWSAPGDYAHMEGAWTAIRFAREQHRPFIGTCGGFQHALIEYARNVAGIDDAQHAETAPQAPTLLITRLACSLVGKKQQINITPESIAHKAYAQDSISEKFVCNFGLNPEYRNLIEKGPLNISGIDQQGEVRIVELVNHPFFIATLFQPQISSLPERPHPLIVAFLKAALGEV